MIKEINKIIKEEISKIKLNESLREKLDSIIRYEKEYLDQQAPRFKENIKNIIEGK